MIRSSRFNDCMLGIVLQTFQWSTVEEAVVDGKTMYKCPTCSKMFTQRHNIREHIENIHLFGQPTCYCGKRFHWRRDLKAHMVRTGHENYIVKIETETS